jgi:hypothetical protein
VFAKVLGRFLDVESVFLDVDKGIIIFMIRFYTRPKNFAS